jgi:hypothetical protein
MHGIPNLMQKSLLLFPFCCSGFAAVICGQQQPVLPEWAGQVRPVETHMFLTTINRLLGSGSKLQEQCELSDTQQSELKATLNHYHSEFERLTARQRASEALLGSFGSEVQKRRSQNDFDAEWKTLANEAIVKLDATLLPHQIARLQQLLRQNELQRQSSEGGFSILEGLIGELGLTGEEAGKFKEDLADLNARYRKELEDLQCLYEDKALESFPTEVQKKVQDLIGDVFHFR